ncbi:hypothetical protein EVAR_6997_1 [Eumeta japonica]|uniref:Uncharacterized protein n=1 Tax=Eumeta variegata TaxID=151549 RepID=A0A4C1TJ93_EUMVA|nr:hypothetical protein EVAR_6997_1 [Eumeta japonica]
MNGSIFSLQTEDGFISGALPLKLEPSTAARKSRRSITPARSLLGVRNKPLGDISTVNRRQFIWEISAYALSATRKGAYTPRRALLLSIGVHGSSDISFVDVEMTAERQRAIPSSNTNDDTK